VLWLKQEHGILKGHTLKINIQFVSCKNGKMPQITGDAAHMNYCISVIFKAFLPFCKPTSYFLSAEQFPFLGMFAKLQKQFIMSDHMERLGSHRMNFH